MSSEETIIIPVASGKGGVGKSVLTANLGIALAREGHSTVLVDLDLGGSNLHLYLGIPNDFAGVGDFLLARSAALSDMLVESGVDNLSFIPGDGRTPGMANITYAHKVRLINNLKKIRAKYLLLDIGSGSSFHNLDFFGMADRQILVITPDLPSIINALTFLKNYLFRALCRQFSRQRRIVTLLKEAQKQPITSASFSVDDVLEDIAAIDPAASVTARELVRRCRPRIIFNQGSHCDQLKLIKQIDHALASINVEGDYFGFVFFDPSVRESVGTSRSLLSDHPQSIAALGIAGIADRLSRRWEQEIPASGKLLREDTKRFQHRHVTRN
jgi:flagellar biosynthesis protein FlhG|tara:strand:+ start:92 stop:1075 length:984 start_codon:yes stop_codon:yes gene_type:complete